MFAPPLPPSTRPPITVSSTSSTPLFSQGYITSLQPGILLVAMATALPACPLYPGNRQMGWGGGCVACVRVCVCDHMLTSRPLGQSSALRLKWVPNCCCNIYVSGHSGQGQGSRNALTRPVQSRLLLPVLMNERSVAKSWGDAAAADWKPSEAPVSQQLRLRLERWITVCADILSQ